MISTNLRSFSKSSARQFGSVLIAIALFAAPLCAQQRTALPAKPRDAETRPAPAFDNLLSADSYVVYGEVRNVGQLLSTGSAGEIADPIMKLADPPQEFKLIVKFLKTNSEALATSRLLFGMAPSRTDIPAVFVAIEFATPEEAAKFAPKLETFLPGILPPVPDATPEIKMGEPAQPGPVQKQTQTNQTGNQTAATPSGSPRPGEHLPFVLSHAGNLVFISDKSFKFEKLHPAESKLLSEDQNFRIARDRFSAESIFLFFNVELSDQKKPKTQPVQVVAETEVDGQPKEDTDDSPDEEMPVKPAREPSGEAVLQTPNEQRTAVVVARPEPSPTATPEPTQSQRVQTIAYSQLGHMMDVLVGGEPRWPEAVGVAVNLDNDSYVVRAILVEPPNSKPLPLPFVPTLVSGPAAAFDAASILPDDTEVVVNLSIDFAQTYSGMRKETEARAKRTHVSANAKAEPEPFADFEKKAGFQIKDDLLPVIGNEVVIAASLKSLQGLGMFGITAPPTPSAKASSDTAAKKPNDAFPMVLIAVKDRDAARRLMPGVLEGLGIGEVNMIAQVEKREDTELINYGGIFAYAFVADFIVISDTAVVRYLIDAYVNHQTLASNNAFRNSRRWQPRQTLGEIWISPAMMEGYQDEVRKSSAKMDPATRDYLLQLSPAADAITYALSNEGLGEMHELHLPKNLILAMVAGTSAAMSQMKQGSPEMNEAIAIGMLSMVVGAETTYQSGDGNGSYGSLDQLVEKKLIQKGMFEQYGYKIEVNSSGDHFAATATPVEYGKTGNRSFFVDQSRVMRGDDHGGAPANASDNPVHGP